VLALQAESILIERIPASHHCIEVPNINRQTIALREIVERRSLEFAEQTNAGYGPRSARTHSLTDLAAMPHLLIAGSTGTGKSVFINS